MISESTHKKWYERGRQLLINSGWSQGELDKLEEYQIATIGEIDLMHPLQVINESFEDME